MQSIVCLCTLALKAEQYIATQHSGTVPLPTEWGAAPKVQKPHWPFQTGFWFQDGEHRDLRAYFLANRPTGRTQRKHSWKVRALSKNIYILYRFVSGKNINRSVGKFLHRMAPVKSCNITYSCQIIIPRADHWIMWNIVLAIKNIRRTNKHFTLQANTDFGIFNKEPRTLEITTYKIWYLWP